MNRISQILELTNKSEWHYVDSKNIPADVVSRGCDPTQFKNHNLWWNGPTILRNELNISDKKNEVNDDKREYMESFVTTNNTKFPPERYSTLIELIRVVVWSLRFEQNFIWNVGRRWTIGTN